MILVVQRCQRLNNRYLPIILVGCYLILFVVSLRTYIVWQSVNLIIGIIILPFVTTINPGKKSGKRFAWVVLLFVLMTCLMPVKTLLFISLAFAVFFVIEQFWGRINALPLLVCLFMSPFFQYVVGVFSFDIRLVLTRWAGSILVAAGDAIRISGNVIEAKGDEFSVDPACIGLNMMVTSVMLGLALIGMNEKKLRSYIKFTDVIIILLVVVLLNVVSNLLRIILLVKFTILPTNAMHDVVGVLCLLVYVVLPTAMLVKYIVAKYGTGRPGNSCSFSKVPFVALNVFMLLAVTIAAVKVLSKNSFINTAPSKMIPVGGYKAEQVMDNVVKLENDRTLIYIKPIEEFYEADHNPMICWRGSGYELKQVKEETVAGMLVLTSTLEKESEKLYTGWWYDNGSERTTSQMRWRWRMLQQARPFSIINITCSSKEELQEQVKLFVQSSYLKLPQ